MYVTLKSATALAEAMTAKQITVRKLAETVGMSPAAIGHLRTGVRQQTTLDVATKISEALGTEPGEIWTVRDAALLGRFLPTK